MKSAPSNRRCNLYAGTCRVCGTAVTAGAGWLYSDTHGSSSSRSRRRASGRWPKFVKCDRCHTLKAAHKRDLPENRPVPVTLVNLGVGAVRAGVFQLGTYKAGVWTETGVYLQLADGTRELVAQLDWMDHEPINVGDSYGGRPCFGGRVLTKSAERELDILGAYAAELYAEAMLEPRDAE